MVQERREPVQRSTMQSANNCLFVLEGPLEELSKMHLRTDSQGNKRENYTLLVNVVLMGHKYLQWRKCKNCILISTAKSRVEAREALQHGLHHWSQEQQLKKEN